MALIRNKLGRRAKAHRHQTNVSPAKAGHVFYVGAAVSLDSQGRIVPGVADGAVRAAGIVTTKKFPDDPNKNHHLDTRNGSDGRWVSDRCENCVEYDQVGEHYFESVLGSPVVGGWAYLVDDDTVSATPTVEGVILGEFTQNKDGGWYVDVGKRNPGLGATAAVPFDLVSPVYATLAADSPAVTRSDVVQLSLTNPGDFNVQAGAQSGSTAFFGVAAEDAQPGDRFRVWRGGYYPVRVQDGVSLPPYVLLGWENTGVRVLDQFNDFASVGRALEPSTGGVGEIVMCEIYWPPALKLQTVV